MKQLKTILDFCQGAEFFMVKFQETNEGDLGKILETKELGKIDLSSHEIRRSIKENNDNLLFVYDLKPNDMQYVDNNLQLLKNNLEEAMVIELVYPGIFTWAFDGVSIKAYAKIPSGDPVQHSTITRYGGTERFYKILRKHLDNIGKMKKGISPDYNFTDMNSIPETERVVGSVNLQNGFYSVLIDPIKMSWLDIIKKTQNNVQDGVRINTLNMKYWTKEINPDFINEAKHIKLKESVSIEEAQEHSLYPRPIRKLMQLRDKGNYKRFLLARFLLSVHNPQDAKFVYLSVLSDEEREHVLDGNCSTQWNYILNNMDRYDCPTNSELKMFLDEEYSLAHPLEKVQKYLDERDDK